MADLLRQSKAAGSSIAKSVGRSDTEKRPAYAWYRWWWIALAWTILDILIDGALFGYWSGRF